MRLVVDTNIVFSGILNTNSWIAKILLKPKSGMNFYSTDQLEMEIARHWQKLRKMAGYNEAELYKATALITHRIKFISVELIPIKILLKSAALLADIDEDDTEFVALAEHIRGQLWTGDKQLAKGLQAKEWKKVITTEQLYRTVYKSG